MVKQLTLIQKLKSLVIVTVSGAGLCAGISFMEEKQNLYSKIIMPTVHLFNPELAHRFGVFTCKYGLLPKSSFEDPETLKTTFCGKQMTNPLGIAAGFDKHGEAVEGLKKLGFAFVEVGTVTPEPQPGNPKPRVYRLPEDGAIINRYGFNSEGHKIVHSRLDKLRKNNYNGIIGVNLGKNKSSEDPVDDYVRGIHEFINVADYFVINISSPNTPGLTDLQKNSEDLTKLLSAVLKARNSSPDNNKPPVFLKLSPDLSKEQKENIAFVLRKNECRVDGLIVSNTSIKNYQLKNENANEKGGLSGAPIKKESTKMIGEMYHLTNGMTIIGVGGISTGQDAYEKIKAGAKYIQLYTSFVYEGPLCASKIKKELNELLEKDGYKNYNDVVGIDAPKIFKKSA